MREVGVEREHPGKAEALAESKQRGVRVAQRDAAEVGEDGPRVPYEHAPGVRLAGGAFEERADLVEKSDGSGAHA